MSQPSPTSNILDIVLAWLIAAFTWLGLSVEQWISILFVTLPAGVWSWYRLIDYLRNRKNGKADN